MNEVIWVQPQENQANDKLGMGAIAFISCERRTNAEKLYKAAADKSNFSAKHQYDEEYVEYVIEGVGIMGPITLGTYPTRERARQVFTEIRQHRDSNDNSTYIMPKE